MTTSIPSPMLILTNQLITGGAEMYVVSVSSWLVERGVRTIVAATPGELVEKLDPRVTYHPTALRDLRARIPLAAWRMRSLIRQHRPKLILTNSMVTSWVARLADPRRTIPIVSVAHGWPADKYWLVARPLAVADRVVAVSTDVRRRLVEAGLPADRCVVVDNGIDTRRFGPRSAEQLASARALMGVGPDEVVAINVGRFVPQKAQHRIIELAAATRATCPELRFVLVGWGMLEDALRARIEALQVQDRVRIVIRPPSVPDLLLASDLYLSTSDWEGMPLSTIEAMAAGLPVVSTDVEGLRALVDPTNGALTPVGDAAALQAAVTRLTHDEVHRLGQGAASRAKVERRFSLDAMCQNLMAVLRDVAG